jgi:PAS domain S-box-containing protein
MIPIDLRTIFLNYILTNIVSLIVMFILWRQSRKRFEGTIYLLIDFVFQFLCVLLIFLRGHISDFISIDLSNTFAVSGAVLGLIGLEYFTGKKSVQIHNYLLIAAYFAIHVYFTFVEPDLAIRNLNSALAYLIISLQCAWLLLKRVPLNLHRFTLYVGVVFVLFSVVNLIRIAEFFISRTTATDYFKAGNFETFVIISYQLLFILLTFSLALMINQRLLRDIAFHEEKFLKAFHSVPYAIIITRLSDGRLLEVNDGFEKITNHLSVEVIGKTTLELNLWTHIEDREKFVSEVVKKEKVNEVEFDFRKKTGELFTGLLSSELITLNNEKCILSVINDITNRKKAEEALRESEERFLLLLNSTAEAIYGIDLNGNCTFCNTTCVEQLKYESPDELLGKNMHNQIHFKHADETLFDVKKCRIFKAFQIGSNSHVDDEVFWRSDGTCFAAEYWSYPQRRNGKIIGAVVTFIDITERKKAEEALKNSEAKFRELFTQMSEGFALHQVIYNDEHKAIDYKIIDINPAFEKQVGITAEKAKEAFASELYGVSPAPYLDIYAHVAETGEPQTFHSYFQPFDRHYDISVFSPGPGFFATIFADITERIQAEEQLRISERNFRLLFENSPLGIYIANVDGTIVDGNQALLHILGSPSLEQTKQINVLKFPPLIENGYADQFLKCIEENKILISEMPYTTKWGKQSYLSNYLVPLANPSGKVERVYTLMEDITERKKAEETLRETKDYLEKLLNYANAPIIVWDNKFRITQFNKAFERLSGRKEPDVLGKDVSILFPPDSREKSMEHIKKTSTGDRWEVVEIEIQSIDGNIHTLLWNSAAIYSPDKINIVATIAQGQNITKRKQAEEKMYKANRLYAVISQVNQAFVHLRDREQLLEQVCNIAIEFGDFRMAWIGIIDDETQLVKPISVAGFEDGYLSLIRKISVSDNPEGRGPTGNAIREGLHYVCNDIENDPNMVLWKNEALKRGYHSSIALPIKLFGKVIGAFSIYSGLTGFFDQQEIDLLIEIAGDLSFALDAIETEKEHHKALIALKESEEKYRLITENASDVIWILNIALKKFTYISPAIEQLRGLTVEEALAEELTDALTPESIVVINDAIQVNLPLFLANPNQNDYYVVQLQQPCKDGKIIWVEVSSKLRFNSEGEIEVVGVSRNIDDRKKMEAEILNSEAELRELNLTKDKFFSIIAHDLRGPFTSLVGMTDVMADESFDLSIDEFREYSFSLHKTAISTFNLLENLLEWSRLQRGIIPFNPVSVELKYFLDNCEESTMEMARKKSIQLNVIYHQDMLLTADFNMLNSIMRNLVSNAIKFTNSGGIINVEAQKDQSGNVLFSVNDTGIGMSAEMISNLFRIDTNVSRQGTDGEPSTGLGLILCKEFVEKHGGSIWVESEVNKGSTFFFSLPLSN